jgi:hypothetical protein
MKHPLGKWKISEPQHKILSKFKICCNGIVNQKVVAEGSTYICSYCSFYTGTFEIKVAMHVHKSIYLHKNIKMAY